MNVSHKKVIVWVVAIALAVHIVNMIMPFVILGGLLWLVGLGVSKVLKHT